MNDTSNNEMQAEPTTLTRRIGSEFGAVTSAINFPTTHHLENLIFNLLFEEQLEAQRRENKLELQLQEKMLLACQQEALDIRLRENQNFIHNLQLMFAKIMAKLNADNRRSS